MYPLQHPESIKSAISSEGKKSGVKNKSKRASNLILSKENNNLSEEKDKKIKVAEKEKNEKERERTERQKDKGGRNTKTVAERQNGKGSKNVKNTTVTLGTTPIACPPGFVLKETIRIGCGRKDGSQQTLTQSQESQERLRNILRNSTQHRANQQSPQSQRLNNGVEFFTDIVQNTTEAVAFLETKNSSGIPHFIMAKS